MIGGTLTIARNLFKCARIYEKSVYHRYHRARRVISRRSSSFNTNRINHIYQDLHQRDLRLMLHYGDLSDASIVSRLLQKIQPDEIYNLGAQSHVQVSFELPEYTGNVDALGTLRILDAIRDLGIPSKYYQAGSSEMFGKVLETPQKETTPFYPRSPYGCAKVYAHHLTVNYREAHGIFACNGILFNHESPRRGGTFVTKKIIDALKEIQAGKQERIFLGNLNALRDWGYAKDYVEAMWLMLQQEQADDYVIATGETHSVREFVEVAAKHFGMNIIWQGFGMEEKGIDATSGKIIVEIDARYFRPSEVETLLGDARKAHEKLGWKPKVGFQELIKIMIDDELHVRT